MLIHRAWRLICVIAVLWATAGAVEAEVYVQVGDLNVRLDTNYQWAATTIRWRGDLFADIENYGGSVETVMRVDDHWVGTAHGDETLLDSSIWLDGHTYDIFDNTIYVGDHAIVTRVTDFGGAYQLRATMDITSDTIIHDVRITGLDASKNVQVVYGHQGTRANRLTEYTAYDQAGNLIDSGETNLDDNTFLNLGPTTTVVQYDPIADNGLMQTLTVGGDLAHDQFLWDRPVDNKFYDRFYEAEGFASPDRQYQFTQEINFFEGKPLGLLSAPVPEPATIGLVGLGGWALMRRRPKHA